MQLIHRAYVHNRPGCQNHGTEIDRFKASKEFFLLYIERYNGTCNSERLFKDQYAVFAFRNLLKEKNYKVNQMNLVPIQRTLVENAGFITNPDCTEIVTMCVEFYKRVGYQPPWICYFVEENNEIIGSAAFKGRPVNNTVEIAYGTMDNHRKKGIGTRICKCLIELSLATDPSVRITARTLPEHNYSTRILEKNKFILLGIVNDPEDGDVWEWEYKKT